MSVPRLKSFATRPDLMTLGLVAVVIAAFGLRVYRLNWDEGRLLHPDELHVVDVIATRISFEWPPDLDNLLDPASSRLNPRSDDPVTGEPRQYAYGALPLLVTDLVATVMTSLTGEDWTSYFDHVHKVGRFLSATLDTGTVLLVFLLGKRLFDRRIGLLAGTLYAFAPMTIQLAHFFTTDSWLTFFVALSLLWTARAAEDGGMVSFMFAGGAFGLALATKGSVLALGAVIAVAALLVSWRHWQIGESATTAATIFVSRSTLAAVGALLCFALFEPYALARPSVYLDQLRIQSGIVRGTYDVAFTRQYVGTAPLMYQVEQLVKWGLGPVAGVSCLAGLVVLVRRSLVRPTAGRIVVVAWVIIQGLIVVLPETKFLRYSAPLLPGLAIAGGLLIDVLRRIASRRVGYWLAGAALGACLIGVLVWTASFASVYAAPHTRLEASRWIYEHVANGSAIGVETWDDALPVPFGTGLTPWDFQYRLIPVDLYGDRPPETAADDIYHLLETVDYVVVASNRVERGVGQLPWRYPVQNRYYELLRSGELGFHLAATFHRYPGIGSVRIDDQDADESFINYDHPLVRIYQKTSLVPRDTYDALMAHAVGEPFRPTRSKADTLMLDEPVGELPVVDDARWSADLTTHSAVALVMWVVLLVLLQIVGLPLSQVAFGRFADGGWSFARLIALLVSAYAVWIGASLRIISFRAIWAFVAVGLVASITWLIRRRLGHVNRSLRQRRTALSGEAVFWIVFAIFLVFRWINPDSWHPFWGGEKPMEFAHINAILRSAHFPPYDPWFADGYINYYFYGLYLVAFCIKLTGIPTEIAFNLAQPTMIALLASTGFGTAASLSRGLARNRSTGIVGGLAGALLLVGIGNLEAITQVVRAFPDPIVPTFVGLTWQASRVIPFTINEFPYFTGLYADLHAHVIAFPMTTLLIALCYAIARGSRTVIVALSDAKTRNRARLELATQLGLIALTLGGLFPTNAWDVPVYAALAILSIFMSTSGLRGASTRVAVSGLVAVSVGGLAYAAFLPFHQHYVALFGSVERVRSHTGFWTFSDHLGGLLAIAMCGVVVLLVGLNRECGPFSSLSPTPVAALLALLVAAALARDQASSFAHGIQFALVLTTAVLLAAIGLPDSIRQHRHAQLTTAVIALGCLLTLVTAGGDRLVLGLMIAMAAAGVVIWLRGDDASQRFAGALIAAASLVAAGVEVVFLADDLVTSQWYRMNTVFKFYNQVWVLFAVAGAALISTMLDRLDVNVREMLSTQSQLRFVPEPLTTQTDAHDAPIAHSASTSSARSWAALGLVVSAVLVLASLAYPLLATKPRLEERFDGHHGVGTLNALDWMTYGVIKMPDGERLTFADDRKLIDWLNSHVSGSPVIAEASIGPYRCNGSRISINTGLPTIIGWERHETQQRYLDGLAERVQDVRDLYASTDPARKLSILREYDVHYVVVGELERYYPEVAGNDCLPTNPTAGIAAFDAMIGTSLEVAFQSGTTTLYRVLPPSA